MVRRLASAAVGIIAAAGAGWHFFGWYTEENPGVGRVTVLRRWGRVTVVRFDANRDGKADTEIRWPWRLPYQGHVDGECGEPWWLRMREDRNLDGTWDTWIARPDTGKPCSVLIRADTNGDGRPDWEELTTLHDSAAPARLKAIRGF
ncbi:MAG: hypothetical protein AB2L07_03120 [Thermoanaerobaculaceae bacterium]